MGKLMLTFIFLIFNIIVQSQGSSTTNCTKLPQLIAPEKCCEYPRLFKENAIEYCASSKEKGEQCLLECIYAVTELCRKHQCDIRKLDDYVEYVGLENSDFGPVYKQAYRECMKAVTDLELDNSRFKDEKCDPQPELIEICVHNKMFTLCPDQHYHSNIQECVHKREFSKNCVRT